MAKKAAKRPSSRTLAITPVELINRLLLLSLGGAAIFAVAVTCIPIWYQLTRIYPGNPWEAGINMEAMRFAMGLPIYEDFQVHATHMYGWMHSVLIGLFYKIVPFSNSVSRSITLVSGLTLAWILSTIASHGRSLWFRAFCFATLFSISGVAADYFGSGRLDITAWLFATLGVIYSYRARPERWQDWVLPTSLIVFAICFKQTAAGFAILPPLAVLATELQSKKPKVYVYPWMPLLGVALYLILLAFFAPLPFHYMFTAFTDMPIQMPRFAKAAYTYGSGSVLLLSLLFAWLYHSGIRPTKSLTWGMVCCLCLFPISLVSLAKAGGGANSMMPFLLSMSMLTLLLISELGLNELPKSWKNNALLALFIGLWVCQTFMDGLKLNRYYFLPDPYQQNYTKLIEVVKTLPDTVSCPEDPTVTFLASGAMDRNIYLERDVRNLGVELPPDLDQLLSSTEYVVDVEDGVLSEYVTPDSLVKRGYALMQTLGTYHIWKKTGPAPIR